MDSLTVASVLALQTSMHRDLYLEALSRIEELELDNSSLKNLSQRVQDMKVTMVRARQCCVSSKRLCWVSLVR